MSSKIVRNLDLCEGFYGGRLSCKIVRNFMDMFCVAVYEKHHPLRLFIKVYKLIMYHSLFTRN